MMNNKYRAKIFLGYLIFLALLIQSFQPLTADPILSFKEILKADHRSSKNKMRDKFRNPQETLEFFGVRGNETVLEITPGMGWYTEILAPLISKEGVFYVANYSLENVIPSQHFSKRYISLLKRVDSSYRDKLKSNPKIYSEINYVTFNPKNPIFDLKEKIDVVLTFRNIHNWSKAQTAEIIFASFFNSLKRGGTLGVVEHRAKPGTPLLKQIETGYMTENVVKNLAKKAGFRFEGSSEINKNPRDTTKHASGVWTLLPIQRGLKGQEKVEYAKIGESDRMTLKFKKP